MTYGVLLWYWVMLEERILPALYDLRHIVRNWKALWSTLVEFKIESSFISDSWPVFMTVWLRLFKLLETQSKVIPRIPKQSHMSQRMAMHSWQDEQLLFIGAGAWHQNE